MFNKHASACWSLVRTPQRKMPKAGLQSSIGLWIIIKPKNPESCT